METRRSGNLRIAITSPKAIVHLSNEREFRLFHADRGNCLKPGQAIELGGDQLSTFGRHYWGSINTLPPTALNLAQTRELLAERVKRTPNFANVYVSRMQAFFGANTVDEAVKFANAIEPRPSGRIPIFEVFAKQFWTLDSCWLDYAPLLEAHVVQYWYGSLSNHQPTEGLRMAPKLEVVMALPVRVGEIVAWAVPESSGPSL